ncbi:hypothetical protein NMG60_11012464 [Bertholletia excelsa]
MLFVGHTCLDGSTVIDSSVLSHLNSVSRLLDHPIQVCLSSLFCDCINSSFEVTEGKKITKCKRMKQNYGGKNKMFGS